MERKDRCGTLVLVRGLPGAGKTTLSRLIASKTNGEGCMRLNPDEIEKENQEYLSLKSRLRKEGVDEDLCPYRYLKKKALEGLRNGITVVWDQPWSSSDGVRYTLGFLKSRTESDLEIHIIDVDLEPEIAWERVDERIEEGGHGPDKEHFDRLVEDFERGEVFGENYHVISGAGWIEEDIEKIIKDIVSAREINE